MLCGFNNFLGMTKSKLEVFSFLAIISAMTTPPRGIPKTIIFSLFFPRCFDMPFAKISPVDLLSLNVI